MHGMKGEIAWLHSNPDSSLRRREKQHTWEESYDSRGYSIPAPSHPIKTTNLFPGNTYNSQYMVNNTTQQYQQHYFYNVWRPTSQHPNAYNNHRISSYNGSKSQSAQEIAFENIPKEPANCSLPTKHANPQDYTRNHFVHKNQNNLSSNPLKIRVRDVHTLNNFCNDYFPNNHQRVENHSSFLETNHSIRNEGFIQHQNQIPCFERSVQKNFEKNLQRAEDSSLQQYQINFLNQRNVSSENIQKVSSQRRSSHPQYFPNFSNANQRSANYCVPLEVYDKTSNSFSCSTNNDFRCNNNMLSSESGSDKNKTINVSSCEKNVSKPVSSAFKVSVSADWRPNQRDQSFSSIRVEESSGPSYFNNSMFTSGTSYIGNENLQNSQRNSLNKINSSLGAPISATKNKSETPRVQNTNICNNFSKDTTQRNFSSLDNPYPNTTFEFDSSGLCNVTHTNNESNFKEHKCFTSKAITEQVNTTKELIQKTCTNSNSHLPSNAVSSNKETGNCENQKSLKLNDPIEKSKSSNFKQIIQTCSKINKKLINLKESEKISKNNNAQTINKTKFEVPNKELVRNELECSPTSTSQFPHFSEKPDIKQEIDPDMPENSASNLHLQDKTIENTITTNSSEEEFKANIDRKKLDKLKKFLENSSSVDNFWCEDIKKDKSPESCKKRKREDEFHSQRRRKLSKSCIVKNKNNQREMISLKSFKTPVKENKCDVGFVKSEAANLEDSVKDNTQDAQCLNGIKEVSNGSSKSNFKADTKTSPKDVALTDRLKTLNKEINKEQISQNKVSNHVPRSSDKNNKRKDSVKENFQRKKKKKSKHKSENSKSCHRVDDDYKNIVDVMKTFQKCKENYCYYCGSLRSADFFWINMVTAELKCLHCFKKTMSTSKDSGKNEKQQKNQEMRDLEGKKKCSVELNHVKKEKSTCSLVMKEI